MITTQRLLKRIHVLGTAWFLLSASGLLLISLRQAGVNWWLVFSISGYSVVLFAFLLTFYLFALFRGVVRAQCSKEHPLSTSQAYLFLYDTAPFLGAAAGLMSSYGVSDWAMLLRMVTEGTLAMTFILWVVLDSLVAAAEALLPGSRRQRAARLAQARQEKERIRCENAALLASLEQSEQLLCKEWEALFGDDCAELAKLYGCSQTDLSQIQMRTVEIGAKAWRLGKIACMRFVHQRLREHMKRQPITHTVDVAALWWDGIGSWRRPKEPAAAFIHSS